MDEERADSTMAANGYDGPERLPYPASSNQYPASWSITGGAF